MVGILGTGSMDSWPNSNVLRAGRYLYVMQFHRSSNTSSIYPFLDFSREATTIYMRRLDLVSGIE
jgi:hypothetical protein